MNNSVLSTTGVSETVPRPSVPDAPQPKPKRSGRRPRRILACRLALIVAVLAIWEIACRSGLISELVLPSPIETLQALWQAGTNGDLLQAFAETGKSWLIGLAAAIVIGNVLGLSMGSNRAILQSTRFIVDFLRSVPAVTLVPLALLIFGSNLEMKLTIIIFGATWDVLIQALYAARQVDPVARDTFKSFNVSRWQTFRALQLPSAAPFLATGARLAATHALLLSIGAELVGGAPGIGEELLLAQESGGSLAALYAFVIAAGLAGLALNQLLLAVESRLLYGHPGYRS